MCQGTKEHLGKAQRGFPANYDSKLVKSRSSNTLMRKLYKGKTMNHCALGPFCPSPLTHP